MKSVSDWPGRLAGFAGSLVALTGAAVLFGWATDSAALKSLMPGWPKMSALTALDFLLTGVALGCANAQATASIAVDHSAKQALPPRWVSPGCAAIVVLIAAIRLGDYLLGWNLGMDTLWFHESAAQAAANPARMAPATALNFLLLGSALLLGAGARLTGAFQFLVVLSALVSWLGLSQYLYGGEPLLPFARMAAHSALAFLLLSAGVLCLRTDVGLMALLTSDTAGAVITRRLVPSVLIVPIVIGWLRLEAQRAGWFGTEAGVSLFALTNMVVFGALVLDSASRLHRSDTERRRAEETRRESQQLLQAIIDNSPAVIYVKDLAGRYLLINRRYEEIFHLNRDAILGSTDHQLFHKEAADAFRAMDQRVAMSDQALTEEESAPLVDGIHAYISVKCPLRDQANKTYAVFGISTDITDRKRAEQRLQIQLERLDLLSRITRAIGERQDLRSIFQVVVSSLEEGMPIEFGCICLRHEENVLIVMSAGVKSKAGAMAMGMSEQAHLAIDDNGLSRCIHGQLVYEPDTSAVPMPFPQRLARHGLRSMVIAPLLVESKVFGVLVAARREAGSFSSPDCEFLRQLSEHVALAAHQAQIHAALQQAYEELRQTQEAVMQQERLRALGEMASGIAHDINNAISPVGLYTESLLETESNLSAHARKYLEIIRRSISDVASTVSRMRDFYRHREPQLTLAAMDLNSLAQQVVDLTRARWSDMPQQRGIVVEMKLELAPQLPAIMGVESEIREALTNLIFNAVDAMPEGGTLTLRTRVGEEIKGSSETSPPRVAQIEVTDTGVGMDEHTRQRCLEPFFSTKGERGTGLGLAMVYGMARRHSAEIEIDSAVDRGTTVRLIFAAPATVIAGSPPPEVPPVMPPRLRILVVDDDPLVLMSLRDTLKADGHVVETAEGGQSGIDAFRAAQLCNQPFAVVITDLGMPHIDGRKVAGAIKEASPNTPVILLTGWGHRMLSEGEIPPHVDRVLGKPPGLGELRETLAALADQ